METRAKKYNDVLEKPENNKKPIGKIIAACLIIVTIIILLLIKGCSGKKYTITFDSNGGSKVEEIKVEKNEKIKKPKDPTKEGYTFEGWYYNDKLFDFDTKITKNMTLKAHWTSGIELNVDKLSLLVGSTEKLDIVSLLDGLSEEDLIWTSSDDSILTVDKNGNLKALKKGTVTVTVKSKDGKYKASCTVTVTDKEIEIESLSINGDDTVTVGDSLKLNVTLNPSDATTQEMTWESSDSSIATVDSNGTVRGLKAGKVTITVTTPNGKKASKTITVKEKSTTQGNSGSSKPSTPSQPQTQPQPQQPTTVPVTGVSINGGDRTKYVGESETLSVSITPGNATNKSTSWSSNNPGAVSVDANGNIYANAPGTATITVTVGGVSASITVTVQERPASYVITFTEIAKETSTFQYRVSITKNGEPFYDYKGVTYNGNQYRFQGNNNTIDGNSINKGMTTASILLTSGGTVSATVVYN